MIKKYKIVRMLVAVVMTIVIAILPLEVFSTRSDEEIRGGGEKIGKLYYQLNQDNMTATVAPPPYEPGVEGTTHPTNVYYDTYEGDIIIPERVTFNGQEYVVDEIGAQAFWFQDDVTSVVLPNTIKRIMRMAFSAEGIVSIIIPRSVERIGWLSAPYAKEVVYDAENAEFESIGHGNFHSFGYSLTKLSIGEDVKKLDGRTFRNNSELTELHYNAIDCEITYDFKESTGYKYSSPFPECVTNLVLGEKVKRIPNYAFSRLFNVENIILPASLEEIGFDAFCGCGGQASITIPKSVKLLQEGSLAFLDLREVIYNAECCDMSGGGNVGEYSYGVFPWDTVEKLLIGKDVKIIPKRAFPRFNITTVDIPSGVESIGDIAFYGCRQLKSVTLPESLKSIGNESFYYCDNLVSITLPSALESIDNGAFYGCGQLKSITLPESLQSIGKDVFDKCENLTELIYNPIECKFTQSYIGFPSSITKLTIGKNVKKIPEYAFRNTGVSSVLFPGSVETIGSYSFASSKLESITFSNSIKRVGKQAFDKCNKIKEVNAESLKNWIEIEFEDAAANPTTFAKSLVVDGESIPRRLVIPDGVTRIGSYVFSNWESMVSVSIPESVTSVGTYAFSGCSGLQRAIFTSLESFLSLHYESERCLIPGAKYINDELLDQTSIIIPRKLSRIPDFTFYNWTTLSKINISEDVTYIGKYAFGRCTALEEIVIPFKVDTIAEGAFSRSKVRLVSIPKSIRYIGPRAFDMDTHWYDISDIWSPKYTNVDIQSINNWTKIEFADELANPIAILKRFTINGEKVKHLDLEASEDNISSYAFINATDLLSVRISAISIGESAFKGCKNIENLCISANKICETSFGGTESIKNIYVPCSTPPVALNNSFSKYDGVNLYVPEGALKAYENAENCWWKFLDVYESDFKDLDEIFKADYGNILVGSIQLTPDNWSGEEGEAFTINATVLPDNATDKSLLWSSSDESVATVNSEGFVTVIKEGNCVIKATAADGSGVYAECVVTGLAGIEEIFAETDLFDIYDLNGILIKKDSDKESLKHLTSGIYIVRVGKMMKKLVIR